MSQFVINIIGQWNLGNGISFERGFDKNENAISQNHKIWGWKGPIEII